MSLTGDGGRVHQFGLINVGEQRQRGVILHNMAALGHKTGSSLETQINIITYNTMTYRYKCGLNEDWLRTWTETV